MEPKPNTLVRQAQLYVKKSFKGNYGSIENFGYPVTHADAKKWLNNFLTKRFKYFGPYEDAILQQESFLFHSVLSPLLNIGLLSPELVIKKAIAYAKKHKIPINSLEGFVRQIIGWREFVRAVYLFEHKVQRSSNFFKHRKKTFQEILECNNRYYTNRYNDTKGRINSICHHIERLMILGNAMLLCQYKPNDAYQWFMELFIDAYDWVMVPNVYGMSQFSDGGLMTTKPYISGSSYIMRMSDYKKDEWCDIWDALYWNFLHKHKKKLSKSPRMRLMYTQLQKMKKVHSPSIPKSLKIF